MKWKWRTENSSYLLHSILHAMEQGRRSRRLLSDSQVINALPGFRTGTSSTPWYLIPEAFNYCNDANNLDTDRPEVLVLPLSSLNSRPLYLKSFLNGRAVFFKFFRFRWNILFLFLRKRAYSRFRIYKNGQNMKIDCPRTGNARVIAHNSI